jgi:hypothetical protein
MTQTLEAPATPRAAEQLRHRLLGVRLNSH